MRNYRSANCECGVRHWSLQGSEVKIKCRCGRLVILAACQDNINSGTYIFAKSKT